VPGPLARLQDLPLLTVLSPQVNADNKTKIVEQGALCVPGHRGRRLAHCNRIPHEQTAC
jgi:hypothetical protein